MYLPYVYTDIRNVGVNNERANNMGKRNPTSTKGRSRWKSSSENYLLISEVRFRVRFMVRVRD